MQDINWHLIYMPRERNNKLMRMVNKLLQILPITQKTNIGLKAVEFQMTGARVDPETKEVLLVLKAKE